MFDLDYILYNYVINLTESYIAKVKVTIDLQ